ncbi:hypothetical protein [Kribbella monticola]|uniref:hypothetical protein n=1 Tax=Kribbella monticola TaxID=2185285 RepID=UPI000DD40CC3|nr:hypothetical protein [Kribbella monticola]
MPAELAGVTAIFTSRTEFSHEVPSTKLFDAAMSLDAMGLSLNLICQQYPDLKFRVCSDTPRSGCSSSSRTATRSNAATSKMAN